MPQERLIATAANGQGSPSRTKILATLLCINLGFAADRSKTSHCRATFYCVILNTGYRAAVAYRTTFKQIWRRLWAALALACVLSLVNGAVAGAAEVGIDLQSITISVATNDAQVSSHQDDGGKKSPSKSHCALCCTHTGVSLLPFVGSLTTTDVADTEHEVRPDRFALFARGEGPDQPPRA